VAERTIYEQIALRTDGNVYIGVVGPVRTGKSTFIKRFMEQLVIPNIENTYRRERARDELPQSGSGKMIMTSEPKFVPEEAVEICPDGISKLCVRLIDSVGYMIPGAVGAADENGVERMVTTPWAEEAIPMTEAAELGTKKVMKEHCTIGIVMTTDGTITDIPRQDYVNAEARAIEDMKATGKPFLVVINSADPDGEVAQTLWQQLEERYGVNCAVVNCLTLQEQEVIGLLTAVLYEFPLKQLRIFMPRWFGAIEPQHPMKVALYDAIRRQAEGIEKIAQAEPALSVLRQLDTVENVMIREVDLGSGMLCCALGMPEELFYEVLSERSGFSISDDADLLNLLGEMAVIKQEYDGVAEALEQVKQTGYGVVLPRQDQLQLQVPEIVKRSGNYAIRLRASAPSIHMMRADVQTEICPIVGDEKQSEELVHYLLSEYEGDTQKLWESNLFGKSLYELVSEGLSGKLKRLPDNTRTKLQTALSRMVNEGSGGLICIIF